MMRRNLGFTLIELMIVVAIIAILASLAISAYQTYVVRAQVSEGLNLAAGAKVPIVDAYTLTGSPPTNRTEAGMTAAPTDTRGSYVTQVNVIDGRIEITFGNQAHSEIATKTLSLTPYVTSGSSVVWQCGYAPPPGGPGAQPMQSSDGSVKATHTTVNSVDARYVPSACR